jgi:hypothetical protein
MTEFFLAKKDVAESRRLLKSRYALGGGILAPEQSF